MDKKFTTTLIEYLDSECSDYGLTYDFKWCEDTANCEVIIGLDYDDSKKCYLNFRHRNDALLIELSEDSFYKTCWSESSVKYFWMKVAKDLF